VINVIFDGIALLFVWAIFGYFRILNLEFQKYFIADGLCGDKLKSQKRNNSDG